MVCDDCTKQLSTISAPDPWKQGSSSGGPGRLVNENKLLRKGIPEGLCEDLLREGSESDLELASARIHARRRGLGPHRKPPESRAGYRERDLGALGRAGFSHEIARTVIDDPGID